MLRAACHGIKTVAMETEPTKTESAVMELLHFNGEGPSAMAIHALKDFEWKKSIITPVNSSAAGGPKTSELGGSDAVTPALQTPTIMCISKKQSINLQKELWDCTDLTLARELAAHIMKRYMHHGKGLYPIAAATAISKIAGGFEDAVDILMLVMRKTSAEIGSNPHTIWQSLRKGDGAASRAFKNVDATLSLVILLHWLRVVKAGAEVEWDPLPLIDSITTFWDALLEHVPPPDPKPKGSKHWMPHVLHPGKPQLLALSRQILVCAHQRRVAAVKVGRVSGHILPRELVDMITDMLVNSGVLLRVTQVINHFQAVGFHPMEVRSWGTKSDSPGSGGMWHLAFKRTCGKGRYMFQYQFGDF